jgi:hypothetical protein
MLIGISPLADENIVKKNGGITSLCCARTPAPYKLARPRHQSAHQGQSLLVKRTQLTILRRRDTL